MRRAVAFLSVFLLLSSAAQAASDEGTIYLAAAPTCSVKAAPFQFIPGPEKKEDSPAANVRLAPQPAGKSPQRIKLEANDDLASVSFPGGAISPYVGASIDLLPLPKYDPETTASQVLAYGLGAGFGCDLGDYTRLSLRYQIRFFPETDSSLNRIDEDEEIHRISFGLQTSF